MYLQLHYAVRRSIRILQINGNETSWVLHSYIIYNIQSKFFTYTNDAVAYKITSNINIYNIDNNNMRKSIFESLTCFIT